MSSRRVWDQSMPNEDLFEPILIIGVKCKMHKQVCSNVSVGLAHNVENSPFPVRPCPHALATYQCRDRPHGRFGYRERSGQSRWFCQIVRLSFFAYFAAIHQLVSELSFPEVLFQGL